MGERVSRLRNVARLARRAAARARRMTLREAATTAYALVLFVVVEATIRWVPLPRLASRLGVHLDLSPAALDDPVRPREILNESELRRFVSARLVSKIWPTAKGPCLRQALVAGHLLRARQPSLRLGVGGTTDSLEAHAWLEIDARALEDVSAYQTFAADGDAGS